MDLRGTDASDDLALQGVDVAIRTGPVDGVPGHVALHLVDFPWVACATPEFLRRRGTPEHPGDLGGDGLIGFRNGGTGRLQAWRFRPAHPGGEPIRVVPDGRIIADDPLSAWDMARLGQGIAWAPHRLAAADIRSGRTVEVLRDWRGDPSPLTVRRRERQIPRRTHAVIALICEGVGHRSERERSDGA